MQCGGTSVDLPRQHGTYIRGSCGQGSFLFLRLKTRRITIYDLITILPHDGMLLFGDIIYHNPTVVLC
jgi:hypothetical protein